MLFADISLSTLALIRYPSNGPSLNLSTDWPASWPQSNRRQKD